MEVSKVKIEIFLPEACIGPMCEALNALGACQVGKYDHVISYQPTQGCWRPLLGSEPYGGAVGELCHGSEYKLELRCGMALVPEVVAAIRANHPYEEPLINILPLLNGYFGVE